MEIQINQLTGRLKEVPASIFCEVNFPNGVAEKFVLVAKSLSGSPLFRKELSRNLAGPQEFARSAFSVIKLELEAISAPQDRYCLRLYALWGKERVKVASTPSVPANFWQE